MLKNAFIFELNVFEIFGSNVPEQLAGRQFSFLRSCVFGFQSCVLDVLCIFLSLIFSPVGSRSQCGVWLEWVDCRRSGALGDALPCGRRLHAVCTVDLRRATSVPEFTLAFVVEGRHRAAKRYAALRR